MHEERKRYQNVMTAMLLAFILAGAMVTVNMIPKMTIQDSAHGVLIEFSDSSFTVENTLGRKKIDRVTNMDFYYPSFPAMLQEGQKVQVKFEEKTYLFGRKTRAIKELETEK